MLVIPQEIVSWFSKNILLFRNSMHWSCHSSTSRLKSPQLSFSSLSNINVSGLSFNPTSSGRPPTTLTYSNFFLQQVTRNKSNSDVLNFFLIIL